MCIIIDSNLAGEVFSMPTSKEFVPLIIWIERSGKVVYGGKNSREIRRVINAVKRIQEWKRIGRAVEILGVDEEQTRVVRTLRYRSDDPHIIALARKSGARTLCSHDQALHCDFKNTNLVPRPRGHIYQNASHVSTLRHTNGCMK